MKAFIFDRVLVHVDYCMIVEKLMKILLKVILLPRDNIDASKYFYKFCIEQLKDRCRFVSFYENN